MKPEWTDTSNGCDGTFGGATSHECALPTPGNLFSSDVYIIHKQKILSIAKSYFSSNIYHYCFSVATTTTLPPTTAPPTKPPTTVPTTTVEPTEPPDCKQKYLYGVFEVPLFFIILGRIKGIIIYSIL